LQKETEAVDRVDVDRVAHCHDQPGFAKSHRNYFETARVFAPDLVDDLWRNNDRGDVDPIHVRLRSERARDIHLRQISVVN